MSTLVVCALATASHDARTAHWKCGGILSCCTQVARGFLWDCSLMVLQLFKAGGEMRDYSGPDLSDIKTEMQVEEENWSVFFSSLIVCNVTYLKNVSGGLCFETLSLVRERNCSRVLLLFPTPCCRQKLLYWVDGLCQVLQRKGPVSPQRNIMVIGSLIPSKHGVAIR